jgi:rhodanese-related sulfurtransferase
MGKEIDDDSVSYFLPTEKYQAHCLSPYEFVAVSKQPKTVVFDIRDIAGRQVFPVNLPHIKHYPVDRVVKLIKSGSRKITRNKVLILDGCGAQSKWLQYVLEEAGVKDYFFLEGGLLNWRRMGLNNSGRKLGQ